MGLAFLHMILVWMWVILFVILDCVCSRIEALLGVAGQTPPSRERGQGRADTSLHPDTGL